MSNENMSTIERLVMSTLGDVDGRRTLDMLDIAPALLAERSGQVSRAAFAMALPDDNETSRSEDHPP